MFDTSGFGLEIGPSFQPVFPKREGYRVETLDYASAEELRAKYASLPVDCDRIEEVDFVSDGRLIDEVIPHRERYDFIFSSHVIEHVTDFVGYLTSCEKLLKPGGVVALAVPDKRYTFDVLQPVTTTGRVLEAHARGQTRHSPAAVYDFFSNFARMEGKEIWRRDDIGEVTLSEHQPMAKLVFDASLKPDHAYHDVHGWIFTPASFRLIMSDLRELGLTTLSETTLVESDTLEFYVTLAKGAPEKGFDRTDLQKALIKENVVSGLQVLAAGDPAMAEVFAKLTGKEQQQAEPTAPARPRPWWADVLRPRRSPEARKGYQ
jgi:predicted SAM-dependent methyltransferase